MLRCTVPEWHQAISTALDANTLPAPDMVWGDTGLVDHRSVYCRQGGFLKLHIEYSANSIGHNTTNTLLKVPATGFLAEPAILRLIRHFCHTGTIVFEKTDALTLLRYYQACEMYDLPAALPVLLATMEDRLDVQSLLPLYDALAGTLQEHSQLMSTVRRTFAAHAQEAISKVSTATATKLSTATLLDMMQVLQTDTVNVCEQDLLEALYWLGLKRNRHDQALATAFLMQTALPEQQQQQEQHEAKRPRLDSVSLTSPWHCIRIKGLTVPGLLAFRSKHPEAMPATWYLDILQAIQTPTEELSCRLGLCEHSLRAPRTFNAASSYPLCLQIPPTDSFALTALQTDTSLTAYIGLLHMRGTAAPFILHCQSLGTLQLTVSLAGTHLSLTGRLLGGAPDSTVTLEVVHFRSNRWRKVACSAVGGLITLPKVITLTALEQDGYTFDARAYPHIISPGPHLLLKLSLETATTSCSPVA